MEKTMKKRRSTPGTATFLQHKKPELPEVRPDSHNNVEKTVNKRRFFSHHTEKINEIYKRPDTS